MATRMPDPGNTDSIKEVIRLLQLALEDCERLLTERERGAQCKGHDSLSGSS